MQSYRYKLSSPRIRGSHSQQLPVKKSASGRIPPEKSIIKRLMFDKKEYKDNLSYLEEGWQQVAITRMKNKRSSSFDKKTKVKLKPIYSRRGDENLPEIFGLVQRKNSSKAGIKRQLGEGDVEEMFYKQVRIQQQFKKLASFIL